MADNWRKQQADTYRALGTVGAVGMAFVLAIVMGFWIGHVLDGWLGTSPWLTLLFFFFGLAAGVVNVYRTMAQAEGTTRKGKPSER